MSSQPDLEIKGSLISYFSNLVKNNGGINLAQGIPGFSPPDELMQCLSKISLSSCHQYAPGTGNSDLLTFLGKHYCIDNSGSKILITNGATEAISLIYNYLMSFIDKDSFNVAAFSPAYESYIHLPRIFKHKLYTYKVDDKTYFDDNDFKSFFETNNIKVLFIASPGNPFGKNISKEKLDFIINLAEKNNAYVILDAVYSELYFGEEKPYYPVKELSPNVFYVNSFSKKFSITGWRIGYFLMNNMHYEKMCYTHDYIGLCAPAPLQQALAEYLLKETYSAYVANIKNTISSNYLKAVKELTNNGFYCPKTDGGYFVWCRLPGDFSDSLSFGLKLYDKLKTAIIPGQHFGEEWNNYIRINIARQPEELELGLKNIISFTG